MASSGVYYGGIEYVRTLTEGAGLGISVGDYRGFLPRTVLVVQVRIFFLSYVRACAACVRTSVLPFLR